MTKPENFRFRALSGRTVFSSYKDVCVLRNLAFGVVCSTKSIVYIREHLFATKLFYPQQSEIKSSNTIGI